MKLFTAEEMRAADRAALQEGIPALLLMEAAGRESARHARTHFPDARHIVVLCGAGNNGGDGYAAARYLRAAGRRVEVLETTPEPRSTESRAMRSAWRVQGGRTFELSLATLEAALGDADLAVDALFGSGLSRPLEGRYAALVDSLNAAPVPVFSIDVPSGIEADRAQAAGTFVRASYTLQLAGPKLASAFSPARQAFGSWQVADIGIPARILDAQSARQLLSADTVRPWFPSRPRDTHKYRVGTVLVVAGSAHYLGAAELACRAALRAGAGLVTLAAEQRPPGSWPEIIFERLSWGERPLHALSELSSGHRAQVRVIGPGLDARALRLLPDIIGQSGVPTVLDAGALDNSGAWFAAVRQHGRSVLTPHAGEASRLLGAPADQIAKDPLAAAQALSERSGAVTILKGASTVIAAPDGRLAVNTCGHPGMATAGSGDVLSGLLGAWLANGDPFERAAATVFVHGASGVRAAERYGDGLIASDLVEAFARVWRELAQGDKLPGW